MLKGHGRKSKKDVMSILDNGMFLLNQVIKNAFGFLSGNEKMEIVLRLWKTHI